ncbi:MAG TPA: peptidoglycan DD-metalloendopeptidase family protein [Actinomycetota bacterium]|jgi:murein DD-endopeptidase MepM/ murein hydrolase activator NlpD|nr:peptidoglycan DD-metalloendopeptidase family protein [Actinomycetota bacterium]
MSRGSRLGPLQRALVVGAALFVVAQVAPGSAKTTVEQIRRAERRVKQIKREVRREQRKLSAIQADIRRINTQVAQTWAHLNQLRERRHEVDQDITRQTRAIDVLQGRLDQRARAAYITGPAAILEAVLGAESLTEMSDRVTFLDVLARQDSDVSIAIDLERDQLREHEVDLKGYVGEEKDVLRDLANQDELLQKKFAAQVATTDRIEDMWAEAKRELRVLEEQRRRELAAILGVGNIGPPLSADGPFFWCPVDAPRSYIDDFGFPRVGHTHQGNDIFAPSGTPIRAPFNGTAREGSGGIGGLSVHVDADVNADYVYNAHLSRFAGVSGEHVIKGQIIGYVGQTGNAASTPPHDHFEYHPGGGSAVSPYLYLNEVCGVGGRAF